MSRLILQEYLNERINDVNTYIKFNERKDDKDFFAHKELELYQMAQKYMELTNELGCPLEVVFKALKYGIYKKDENIIFEATLRIYNGEAYLCQPYDDQLLHKVLLKNHKKTWCLKEDMSE